MRRDDNLSRQRCNEKALYQGFDNRGEYPRFRIFNPDQLRPDDISIDSLKQRYQQTQRPKSTVRYLRCQKRCWALDVNDSLAELDSALLPDGDAIDSIQGRGSGSRGKS